MMNVRRLELSIHHSSFRIHHFFAASATKPFPAVFSQQGDSFLTNTAGEECEWNGTPDDFQPTGSGSSLPRVSRRGARAGFSEELQRRAERLDKHLKRF